MYIIKIIADYIVHFSLIIITIVPECATCKHGYSQAEFWFGYIISKLYNNMAGFSITN